jgi:hypothetical protein
MEERGSEKSRREVYGADAMTERFSDPFLSAAADPFQPLGLKRQPVADLAQADTNQTDLMSWLRSAEGQREYRQLTGTKDEPLTPEPQLPPGVDLQPSSERNVWQLFVPCGGYRYTVYKGTKAELLKNCGIIGGRMRPDKDRPNPSKRAYNKRKESMIEVSSCLVFRHTANQLRHAVETAVSFPMSQSINSLLSVGMTIGGSGGSDPCST